MLLDIKKVLKDRGLSPRGVVHVGGNTGEEMNEYLEMGMHDQLWFEPNPTAFKQLQSKAWRKDRERIKVFNVALGSEPGIYLLNLALNGQSSSLLEPKLHLDNHPDIEFSGSVAVEVERLDSILEEKGIDPTGWLLCADVQGYELEVLKGTGKYLESFSAVYLELNEVEMYKGCALAGQVTDFLWSKGFELVDVSWTGKGWGDGLFLK